MAPVITQESAEPTTVLAPCPVKRPAAIIILDEQELLDGEEGDEWESVFDLDDDIASSVEDLRLNLVSWSPINAKVYLHEADQRTIFAASATEDDFVFSCDEPELYAEYADGGVISCA